MQLILRLMGAAVLLLSTPAAVRADQGFTDSQRSTIETIVHDYFLNHPEAFIEAARKAQDLMHASKDAGPKASVSDKRAELVADPLSPVTGNPNGDVTIVEFFDYRCPYCKRNHADLAQLVKADPNLRVVYKDFPVLGPDSIVAARATLAAIPQGGYQRLHDAILQASGPLSADDIFALADTAGLSSERIAHDMTSPEVESAVNRNIGLARALGISGTPTFVIGDRIIPGAIDLAGLRQLVKAQRSAAQIPTDTKPPAARDGAPQQTGGTTDARATN